MYLTWWIPWLTDAVNLCPKKPLGLEQVPSNYHSEIQRSKDVLYITMCNHVISVLLGLSIMKAYHTHILAISEATLWSASSSSHVWVGVAWFMYFGQFERIWPTKRNKFQPAHFRAVYQRRAPTLGPTGHRREPQNGPHESERVIQILRKYFIWIPENIN